ncbi:14066_t:CDS:1, partial [Ambispora leptoticha]
PALHQQVPTQPIVSTVAYTRSLPSNSSININSSGSIEHVISLLQEVVSVVKNNNDDNNHLHPVDNRNYKKKNVREPTCFACQQPEHFARNCLNMTQQLNE